LPYITCKQKKTQHKVHVSVCKSCRGINCPDYYNYLQLSLFPDLIPDERTRRKFQPERGLGDPGPVVNPPEQMSWLKKPGPFCSV